MLIVNPGTRHFNPANGAPIINYALYIGPSGSVAAISNNPAKL